MGYERIISRMADEILELEREIRKWKGQETQEDIERENLVENRARQKNISTLRGGNNLTNVPDVQLMSEIANGQNIEFKKEFKTSEVFVKMCTDIQDEANKGNFRKEFYVESIGGIKAGSAAKEEFENGGYLVTLTSNKLYVTW